MLFLHECNSLVPFILLELLLLKLQNLDIDQEDSDQNQEYQSWRDKTVICNGDF